jgi:hypothetical protein
MKHVTIERLLILIVVACIAYAFATETGSFATILGAGSGHAVFFSAPVLIYALFDKLITTLHKKLGREEYSKERHRVPTAIAGLVIAAVVAFGIYDSKKQSAKKFYACTYDLILGEDGQWYNLASPEKDTVTFEVGFDDSDLAVLGLDGEIYPLVKESDSKVSTVLREDSASTISRIEIKYPKLDTVLKVTTHNTGVTVVKGGTCVVTDGHFGD